jgi:hypothetical protein
MFGLLLKIACAVGLIVLGLIVFVHLLPWIIGFLAVLGLVKMYHHWSRRGQGNAPPDRWPWRKDS